LRSLTNSNIRFRSASNISKAQTVEEKTGEFGTLVKKEANAEKAGVRITCGKAGSPVEQEVRNLLLKAWEKKRKKINRLATQLLESSGGTRLPP